MLLPKNSKNSKFMLFHKCHENKEIYPLSRTYAHIPEYIAQYTSYKASIENFKNCTDNLKQQNITTVYKPTLINCCSNSVF